MMRRIVVLCQILCLSQGFHVNDQRIRRSAHSRSTGRHGSLFPSIFNGSLSEAPRTVTKYASIDIIQGSSLQIFPFPPSENDRRLRIDMTTDGRPLEAKAELWQGPNYTPQKVRVYSENGRERPFRAVMETPKEKDLSCAVKNIGSLEFPLTATVKDAAHLMDEDANPFYYSELIETANAIIIQGGAIRSFRFEPFVQRAKIVLETNGLPLCARIEISQGPNNNKQVFDIYSENGQRFPFSLAVEMPGAGNVMRITNAATVEYPIIAWVESYVDQTMRRTQQMGARNANGSSQYNTNKNNKNNQLQNGSSNVKLPSPKRRVPTLNDSKFFPTW